MFKNHLIIVFRTFWKNKVYFFINIAGLSIAIASCIIAYLNYRFDESFNTFHPDHERTFKINGVQSLRNHEQNISITPLPLGPQVMEENPNIENACRYVTRGVGLREDKRSFNQRLAYADKSFFELFNFPFMYGDKRALLDPNQIILSKETSEKLFGHENPIGKQIRVRFSDKYYPVTIGGVLEEIPKNSSLDFDALTSFDNFLRHEDINNSDWSNWVHATFIRIKSLEAIPNIEKSLANYISIQNENNPSIKIKAFYTNSIQAMAKSENQLFHSTFKAGMQDSAIFGLIISALMTLLLACFNFVNTTLALSNKRLKEIGIRKVLGGTRQELMRQFILENLGLILIAIIGGLALAEVLIPSFNAIFTFIELKMSNLDYLSWAIFLPFMFLVVGLLAGFYPAFYLSFHDPVDVLKGKVKHKGVGTYSKVLLVLQFAFTVYNLIFGYAFYKNNLYQHTLDRGYAWEDLLLVPIEGEQHYTALKDALRENPQIEGVSASVNPIGFRLPNQVIEFRGEEYNVGLLEVGHDYSEVLGLTIKQGKALPYTKTPETYKGVLINEYMQKEFGWKEPIGQRVKIDSNIYQVQGIIKNFYETSFLEQGKLRPVVIKYTKPTNYTYMSVRAPQEDLVSINEYVKNQWAEISPDIPYEGFYQDRFRMNEIRTNNIILKMSFYFTVISVLITFLSLYTLVSLTIQKRMKEIGVRKILGATIRDITYLLSQGYAYLLLIGSILGIMLGYYAIELLLDIIYTYRMPTQWHHFAIPVLMIIFIAVSTVGFKILRTAQINPINYLRDE